MGSGWEIVPESWITHDAPAEDFVFHDGTRYVFHGTMDLSGSFGTGPYLVLPPTGANGETKIQLRVANVPNGIELMFHPLTVIPTFISAFGAYDPAAPMFDSRSFPAPFNAYHFPATKKENRNLVFPQ